MKQYLYVMSSGARTFKVGISINPMRRLSQIRTSNSSTVRLVEKHGPYNAARRLECSVHTALSQHRSNGEWFSCTESDVIGAVRACLSEFSDDRDLTAEELEQRDRESRELFEELVRSITGPQPPIENIIPKAIELIEFYKSECKEWEANFMEANDLIEFYVDHAKHFSMIAQKAMDQVQRLEAQLAELKAGCAIT